jgi:hypothetical protein
MIWFLRGLFQGRAAPFAASVTGFLLVALLAGYGEVTAGQLIP